MARSITNEQILTMLAEGPERIADLTDGLEPKQLHTASDEGQWSLNDILAHLQACSDMWGDCIERILTEEKPTIRAVNPRTWITRTDYPDQNFHISLQAFTEQRSGLLKLLESLPPENWSRNAIITGAGKPLERTIYFYAQWLATHEGSHIKHIKRMVDGTQ